MKEIWVMRAFGKQINFVARMIFNLHIAIICIARCDFRGFSGCFLFQDVYCCQLKKGFFVGHFALILWHGCHRQKYDEVQTQCINFILEALKNGGCFFTFFRGWDGVGDVTG